MTYEETLDFLYQKLPMYQRVGKVAYKKDLSNTIALLEVLDNPHRDFKSVHIAGTNGKGTSAHGIAAIMQVAGYKTGLYTSPHLKNFTERIKINGKEVDQEFIVRFVEKIRPHIEQIQPSFFEITVAMAFSYFSEEKVDIAIIETGLGGRLDSTNVITPEVCLITNIGFDHMDMLGDTLEKIATEKAGIIKSGIPVVLGSFQKDIIHVFEEKANSVGAKLIIPEDDDVELEKNVPYYKSKNKLGIIRTATELRKKGFEITGEQAESGFEKMESLINFKGRFQVIQDSPQVIADVSHNTEGLQILFDQIQSQKQGELYLIFGTVKDKDLKPIFDLIPKESKITWTQSSVPRALPAVELKSQAEKSNLGGIIHSDVNLAVQAALESANEDDIILITGSTFVVAELDNL